MTAVARAPRLTFLLTSLDLGGAQDQVVRVAAELADQGVDVRLVSMIPADGYTDQLNAAGVPWATLGMRPGRPDPRAILRLNRLIRRWRPDVVHAHMVHANLLGRIARPLAPIPVLVSTAHSIDEGGRAREIAYRLTDRLTDHTTNVSRAAVERYIAVGAAPRHRISRVPNGVDIDRFRSDPSRRETMRRSLGLDPTAFLWLAVGRLDEAKDYPTMLNAFSQVGRTDRESVLIVAGDGPGEASLAQKVHGDRQEDRIRLLGRRSDIPDLMAAADAYVMSSAWEGLPMVLLEAAAAGLPIVATDVGGNREIAQPAENAILVPPGNPGALATSMEAVEAATAPEREAMGAAGRRIVAAEFALPRVIERWQALYDGLLAERGLSAGRGFSAPVP